VVSLAAAALTAGRRVAGGTAAVLAWWLLVPAGGCSRQTELRGEADAGSTVYTPNLPEAGTLPEVPDAGLDDPALPACAERPTGDCVGVNDFPCDFSRWVNKTANECLASTDCKADGWVGVQMTEEGCVSSLHMEEPEDAFVACMAESLRGFRCPCREGFSAAFLGLDNDGCFVGCTDELPCTEGFHCVSGFCVEDR
jgi:hypothetical protein